MIYSDHLSRLIRSTGILHTRAPAGAATEPETVRDSVAHGYAGRGVAMTSATAAWVQAITTGGAFLAVVYQIVLRRQSEDKQQASHITSWLVKPWSIPMVATVRNTSDEPVHSVILTLVAIQGAAARTGTEAGPNWPYRTFLSVLPPGTYYLHLPSGGHAMHLRFAVEIAFVDSFGRSWVRLGDGTLKRLHVTPDAYYKLGRPLSWQYPEHSSIEELTRESREE